MNPMMIEAVQTIHDRLPTIEATAPIENNTSGGTPLATQNAPVQSIPRSSWAAAGAPLSATVLTPSPASLLELLLQRLGDLEDIGDDAVTSDAEDRGTGIGIDRHNGTDVLHAGQMLDRTRNAHRQIQLAGPRGLAGLADLAALRQPARIRDRARAAEDCADRVGELAELLDVGFLTDPAADRENEFGRGHVHIIARRRFDELKAPD